MKAASNPRTPPTIPPISFEMLLMVSLLWVVLNMDVVFLKNHVEVRPEFGRNGAGTFQRVRQPPDAHIKGVAAVVFRSGHMPAIVDAGDDIGVIRFLVRSGIFPYDRFHLEHGQGRYRLQPLDADCTVLVSHLFSFM